MSVAMFAGATPLARMPCSPSSTARHRVRWATPALAARYGSMPTPGVTPAPEAMFTIAPPPWSAMRTRRGSAAGQHAEQIDRHDPLEVAKVVVEEAAEASRDAGDVAHHIKAAEAFHGRSDQSLDLRRVRHIGLHELGALTELLDDLCACLTDVGDNHERSGRDESLRRDAVRCPEPHP